jgi:hypothetical protein
LRPARAVLAAGALAGLLVLAALASVGRAGDARAFLQARELPQRAFPSGDALAILHRLERLHPLPPAPGAAPGRRAETRIALAPLGASELEAALRLPLGALADGLPRLALVADPAALERLYAHPRQRGNDWEVPAFVTLAEGGTVRLTSRIGLRLHGGFSRLVRSATSHRLYFRKQDGTAGFPVELFPGLTGPPPQRLVLRLDGAPDAQGRTWHFVTPLAYDLARRLGLPAPATLPVLAHLNGEPLGVRILTEHLSVRRERDRLGHDRFVLVETKLAGLRGSPVRHGDAALWRELVQRVTAKPALTEAELADVDLDNLARWWVLVLFCDTSDAFQGTLTRDLATPGARWRWTAWDLDQSFGRVSPPGVGWVDRQWLGKALEDRDLRAQLLRRLLPADPAFRARFTRLWDEALNHHLTASYLHERVRHYQELIARFELPPASARRLNPIWRDVEARNLAVRAELERRFALPPSHRVELTGPPGLALTIDGHPATLPYRGWYFEGRELVLEAAAESALRLEIAGRTLEAREAPVRLPVAATMRVVVLP